jgi:hypothetical protein
VIYGRLELSSMRQPADACRSEDVLALRSARPFCAKSPARLALLCRQAYGLLFNAASPRNRYSVISGRVKFRPLWKPFSLVRSFPLILALM